MSENSRRKIPNLPFRKMRGMRNVVAHDYANVDMQIVWEVATLHVPELRAVLEEFLAKWFRLRSSPVSPSLWHLATSRASDLFGGCVRATGRRK